jgi:hypothetical protein
MADANKTMDKPGVWLKNRRVAIAVCRVDSMRPGLTFFVLLCMGFSAQAGEAGLSKAPPAATVVASIDIPDDADLDNTPCAQAIGKTKAKALVQECIDISSASHPPCNAANACRLMIDEIKRGCAASGSDAPEYCAEFEGD